MQTQCEQLPQFPSATADCTLNSKTKKLLLSVTAFVQNFIPATRKVTNISGVSIPSKAKMSQAQIIAPCCQRRRLRLSIFEDAIVWCVWLWGWHNDTVSVNGPQAPSVQGWQLRGKQVTVQRVGLGNGCVSALELLCWWLWDNRDPHKMQMITDPQERMGHSHPHCCVCLIRLWAHKTFAECRHRRGSQPWG